MKLSIYIPVIYLLIWPVTSAADSASSANKKGIKAFNEQKYDESTKHFEEAVIERPDSPELKFNLGTALSEQNEWEKALSQLGAATQGLKTDSQKAAAHYNAGNTLFVSGNTEEAIKEYKKAVKLDQSSEDIRHNLEVAVRKLQNQKNQQQTEKENKDGKNKEKNEDEKEDSSGEENKDENKEEQDDEQQKESQSQEDDKQQQDQQQQQSKQQDSENRPMTPEEARRILDALNDEEKKALALRRMQMKTDMRQGDDW